MFGVVVCVRVVYRLEVRQGKPKAVQVGQGAGTCHTRTGEGGVVAGCRRLFDDNDDHPHHYAGSPRAARPAADLRMTRTEPCGR
jgi:hypothetical protein